MPAMCEEIIDEIQEEARRKVAAVEELVEESKHFVSILESPAFKEHLASGISISDQGSGSPYLKFRIKKDSPLLTYVFKPDKDPLSEQIWVGLMDSIYTALEKINTVSKCLEYDVDSDTRPFGTLGLLNDGYIQLTIPDFLNEIANYQIKTGEVL